MTHGSTPQLGFSAGGDYVAAAERIAPFCISSRRLSTGSKRKARFANALIVLGGLSDLQIPTVEPIAEIELEMPPAGGPTFGVSIKFAGEPPVLYTTASEWSRWNRDWVWWHVPDAAALTMLIALSVMVGMMWKARGRGRMKGRAYCARCNHELVAPQIEIAQSDRAEWSDLNARCPECGSRQPPEIAGAYARRVKWKLLAWATVFGLSGTMFAMTLVGRDRARQSGRQLAAWPAAALKSVWEEWPLYRATPVEALRRTVVWRVPLDGSEPVRLLVGGTSFTEPFISENGRVVALPLKHATGITFLDQRTGHVRDVVFPTARRMYPMVAGFGPEARSVLVAMEATEPTRIEFWHVETESGHIARVGLIDIPNGELPIMQFIPPVAVENEHGVRWAFAGATNRTEGFYRAFAFVGGPDGWKQYEMDYDTPLASARLSPDLSGVRLQWDPAENRLDPSRKFWNFEAGVVEWRASEVPAPRVVVDRATTKAGVGLNARVLSATSDDPIAILDGSAGLGSNWRASLDGRFVAGVVSQFSPSWMQRWTAKWLPVRTARLVVWRIPMR